MKKKPDLNGMKKEGLRKLEKEGRKDGNMDDLDNGRRRKIGGQMDLKQRPRFNELAGGGATFPGRCRSLRPLDQLFLIWDVLRTESVVCRRSVASDPSNFSAHNARGAALFQAPALSGSAWRWRQSNLTWGLLRRRCRQPGLPCTTCAICGVPCPSRGNHPPESRRYSVPLALLVHGDADACGPTLIPAEAVV